MRGWVDCCTLGRYDGWLTTVRVERGAAMDGAASASPALSRATSTGRSWRPVHEAKPPDPPLTELRISLLPRLISYGCEPSSCSTTRTTLAENCDTRTSVMPPRATRSYADGVSASDAPLMSTTTRYGASRVKS